MLSEKQIVNNIIKYLKFSPGASIIDVLVDGLKYDESYSLDLPMLMEDLVDTGSLIQIEYSIPKNYSYFKSCYFARSSIIEVRQIEDILCIICNSKRILDLPKHSNVIIRK